MGTFRPILFASLVCAQVAGANTYWQVTHNGWDNGQCKLESNSIRVTVNPFHADVEEEATITALGTVNSGDPATLEIVGDFQFTPGTALRSLLLWNKTKLLKAKLLDRMYADSLYEATVDRTKPVVISHDPAVIEYLGDNAYRFRIYPVAINQSRKIRILYSVPLQAVNGGPMFDIKTAFTYGASQSPSQIPVEIRKSSNAFANYILAHGAMRKTIQFGVTYLLPYEDFVSQPADYWYYSTTSAAISIIPDSSSFNRAYCYKLDSTNAPGNYSVIFSTIPDTLAGMLRELSLSSYTLEAKIIAGEKAYVADVPYSGCFGVYLKSTVPWDKKIYWTVYDGSGNAVYAFTQAITPDTTSESNSFLPLFWGAKYTLSQGTGSLGGLFGYVDGRMTLLALEKDTLSAAEAAKWVDAGVPPLLPGDIILKMSEMPLAPKENVIFEFNSVKTAVRELARVLKIAVMDGGRVLIDFGKNISGSVSAMLVDMSGRVVMRWDHVTISGQSARLLLKNSLHGVYVMRIKAGGEMIQKKIVLK